MRRPVLFVIILLLLPALTAAVPADVDLWSNEAVPSISENAIHYEDGYRYNVQGLIYVYIEGDAYERGYQHGYLLYPEIMDMLYRWSNTIHNAPIILQSIHVNQSSSRYDKISSTWWSYLRNKAVDYFWDFYPLEYQNEIRGIAESVASRGGRMYGDPVTYEDILTLNEMYELISMVINPQKSIHPLRTLYYDLLGVIPELENKENEFVVSLAGSPHTHHCNGFFATGDATTNGQIVASHSTICGGWWYNYYIAQRWNVILDINPSSGNRLMVTTSPGLIWSDEDYYQNERGILLIETTNPQGLWKKNGMPLAIRARSALQYGNSIDDVVAHLSNDNNGIMNAVWLIGDTKTGEIARFELGLYASAIWRTKNGFYWSANNPIDAAVRKEQLRFEGIKGRLFQLAHLVFNTSGYQYYVTPYVPAERDLKFEELGNQHYGTIDIEVVKSIMSASPINEFITDCKVTDTELLSKNGLWIFWGRTGGDTWNTSDIHPNLRGVIDVPNQGWVKVYGIDTQNPIQFNYQPSSEEGGSALKWSYDFGGSNDVSASGVILDDTVYMASTSGTMYALDSQKGTLRWEKSIGDKAVTPGVYNGRIFAGADNGLYALNSGGTVDWKKDIDVAGPVIASKYGVVVGSADGTLSCFSISDGTLTWSMQFNSIPYPSTPVKGFLFVGAGDSCYCLDAESGNTIWETATQGPITAPPYAYNDSVYLGSWDTSVYALDINDGSLQWKTATGWGIDSVPVALNDKIFVGSMDNSFYAFDRQTGDVAWAFTARSSIRSSPALYGGYVFFGSDDGYVYAINTTTGRMDWSFAQDNVTYRDVYNYRTTPVHSHPCVGNQTIFVGAGGTIYALDAQTVEKPYSEEGEDGSWSTLWIALVFVAILVLVGGGYWYYHRRLLPVA